MSTTTCRSRISRSLAGLSLAATLSTGLSGTALADTWGAKVTDLLHRKLYVRSDGEHYTSLRAPAEIIAEVRIDVDVGTVGAINSWTSKLGLWNDPEDPILYFHDHAIGDSYSWPNRPDVVVKTIRFNVPFFEWEDYVVVYCNQQATRLRGDGFDNDEIFSEDRPLDLKVRPWVTADTSGAGSNSPILEGTIFDSLPTIEVVCEKTPGVSPPEPEPPRRSEAPEIVDSGLDIQERSGLSGVCEIRLDAWITTFAKNEEVRYRYQSESGKNSQVWTVNSGQSRTATASHWYDIANSSDPETGMELPETDRVRLVGVSHSFFSDWTRFEMNCVEGGPSGFTASLPPKLSMAVVERGEARVRGHICPTTLKLTGLLEGRGKVAGKAAFVGPRWFSAPRDYEIDQGEKLLIGADYEIDWDDAPEPSGGTPLRLVRSFDFNATNSDNEIVASRSDFGHEAVCRPIANNTLTATLPPKLSMRFVEQGKVRLGGWVCPATLKLVGLLEGRSPFSGQAAFVGRQWLSAPRDYSLSKAGDKALIGADYDVPWHKLPALPEGEIPHWEVRVDFNATDGNNVVVASLERQLHVAACTQIRRNPAVRTKGDMTLGTTSPQAGAQGSPALKALRIEGTVSRTLKQRRQERRLRRQN